MTDRLVSVSIIISSYNKAQYVGLAVESALNQTYPAIEVIVVDDGSRDASLQVLHDFETRIILIEQANGGQAAALNRGFQVCHGEIIFFLDCDDLLHPDTVARTVSLWGAGISKVHFQLTVIDAEGKERHGVRMPPYGPLPAGDLSPLLRQFGFYPSPPTSGNAYSRDYLQHVLPIPERVYKAWPDTYLVGLAPLFGKIATLEGIGGQWRHSGDNHSIGGVEKLVACLRCDEEMLRTLKEVAGPKFFPSCFTGRWPQYLKYRLLLARFGRAEPTIYAESVTAVAREFVWCVIRWPGYSLRRRVLFVIWGLLVGILPAKMLKLIPGISGPYLKLS